MKKNAPPDKDKDKAQSKTKTTKAQKTVAPLTARAQGETETGRDKQPNPWLSKQVTQRLEEGRSLIIDLATDLPFSAVLHDIHGGQWVYAKTGEHSYTRRRIQVARLAGGDAVLSSSPPAGTPIVTEGSAALFGTEVMTGK